MGKLVAAMMMEMQSNVGRSGPPNGFRTNVAGSVEAGANLRIGGGALRVK
jgi:hypothetical protein